MRAAPNSAQRSRPSVAPGPVHTTEGSPNLRASVISSQVTFFTSPPACSASTRISAMPSPPASDEPASDELARGEEFGRLDAAVALVLDDHPGLAARQLGVIDHLRGRAAEPDRGRVDARVGEAERLHRLLLRRHDALERRVAWLVNLLDHADRRGKRGLDLVVTII